VIWLEESDSGRPPFTRAMPGAKQEQAWAEDVGILPVWQRQQHNISGEDDIFRTTHHKGSVHVLSLCGRHNRWAFFFCLFITRIRPI